MKGEDEAIQRIERALLRDCIDALPPRARRRILKEYRDQARGLSRTSAPGHAEWYEERALAAKIAEELFEREYLPDGYEAEADAGVK